MDPITKLARNRNLRKLVLLRQTIPNSKARQQLDRAIDSIIIANMNIAPKNQVLARPRGPSGPKVYYKFTKSGRLLEITMANQ
jgi:hypothetical protein